MELLAYGEDSLTLWALTNKLPVLLQKLGDSSSPQKIKIFYRPSFGRKGGENSSQFGEFDFIILSAHNLYLGESKWDKSSETIVNGILSLRDDQLLRHQLFAFYVTEWLNHDYHSWKDFADNTNKKFQAKFKKPVAPAKSTLAINLQTVLQIIKQHFTHAPNIINVLLFLHREIDKDNLPQSTNGTFDIIDINYANDTLNNYIKLNI